MKKAIASINDVIKLRQQIEQYKSRYPQHAHAVQPTIDFLASFEKLYNLEEENEEDLEKIKKSIENIAKDC
jgi:hypothetical protein